MKKNLGLLIPFLIMVDAAIFYMTDRLDGGIAMALWGLAMMLLLINGLTGRGHAKVMRTPIEP